MKKPVPPRKQDRELSHVGEETILEMVRRRHPPYSGAVLLGAGDDAAVLEAGGRRKLLAAADLMVEGTHFKLDDINPADLGYKLAAVNVSDLAAMGGRPLFGLLSMALPSKLTYRFATRFWEGLVRGGKTFGFDVVGGDTASSPAGIFLNLALLGRTVGKASLTRSGAKAGDLLYVTGHLGGSALGLAALTEYSGSTAPAPLRPVIKRHLRPDPPLGWGMALARNSLASSAIDISDGFSTDLGRVCQESGVGALVDVDALPLHPSSEKAAAMLLSDPLECGLHGGEEYELLFTVPPKLAGKMERLARRRGVSLSAVGVMLPPEKGIIASRGGKRRPLRAKGWKHFPGKKGKRS